MSNENEITIAPGLWKRLEGAVSGRRVLKALSVQQPFANLIADGSKTIEIRPRGTTHRGPLLIVSSKRPDVPPAGCALAVVNLVDSRPMTIADERAAMGKRPNGGAMASAISPRVGRRNDERSKGASTTSHAAIR